MLNDVTYPIESYFVQYRLQPDVALEITAQESIQMAQKLSKWEG